jgi:DNA-binding YbaB/EbfC family protein
MQEKLQKQMEATVVDATAGGGMVSVKMNGQKQLLSIQIDPEVFSGGDKDMLQDLIVAAVNEGIRKVDDVMQSQLGSLTGGLKIPGLF